MQVQYHRAPRSPGRRPHRIVDRLPAAVTALFVAVAAVEISKVVAVAVRQQTRTVVPGSGRREQRVVVLRVHRHGLSPQSVRTEQRSTRATATAASRRQHVHRVLVPEGQPANARLCGAPWSAVGRRQRSRRQIGRRRAFVHFVPSAIARVLVAAPAAVTPGQVTGGRRLPTVATMT